MLFLLSPAKSLDYDSPVDPGLPATQPQFMQEAQRIIEVLRQKTAADLSALMDISEKIAQLNVERNRAWRVQANAHNARQAAWAFNGDVYEGWQASTMTEAQAQWAQEHVIILSGLYGALRPMDWLQPYRLEMGTRLPVEAAENLYQYWDQTIATYLSERLQAQKTPVIINLASNEYFRVVNTKKMAARVIECVFQDEKAGAYKIVSFYAKRARGLMARYAADHAIEHPEKLKAFDRDGYRYDEEASSSDKWVFRRPEAARA